MTTQTHTGGPWVALMQNPPTVMDRRGCRIATACQLPGDSAKEQQANARLIAAAPELLNACKELVKHLDSLPDDTEKCRHLKMALNNRAGDLMLAAIAKAEWRAE